jgi:hypothetical protein
VARRALNISAGLAAISVAAAPAASAQKAPAVRPTQKVAVLLKSHRVASTLHTCVRLANANIAWLAARIGPGVPVDIS